jgi:FKBP-type peptidyl-prolyl cis-trans isomerase
MKTTKPLLRLVAVLCITILLGATLSSCAGTAPSDKEAVPPEKTEEVTPTEADGSVETTPVTELLIEDIQKGKGSKVKKGDTITIKWAGFYQNGFLFESSDMLGELSTFKVGKGEVIKGWDQGVIGMKKGGTRRLTVPADLAFGEEGDHGMVPPNEPLIFEITLTKIK